MSEVHITLYGDDAAWFQEMKRRITEDRDGNEPSNAEVARLLMQHANL